MKNLFFTTALFLLFSIGIQAQGMQRFFEKYSNDERIGYTRVEGVTQSLSLEIDDSNRIMADDLTKQIKDIVKKEKFKTTVESRNKKEFSYVYTNEVGESIVLTRDNNEWKVRWNKPNKGKLLDIVGLFQKNFQLDSDLIKNLQELGRKQFPKTNWDESKASDLL